MLCPMSLITAAGALRADPTVPAAPDLPMTNITGPTREAHGSRPDHLWTVDYLDLLWSDTGAILTAPARWDQSDWLEAGLAGAAVGGTAAFDKTVNDSVQAHRTAGEDRFMKQFQNFGSVWSFGLAPDLEGANDAKRPYGCEVLELFHEPVLACSAVRLHAVVHGLVKRSRAANGGTGKSGLEPIALIPARRGGQYGSRIAPQEIEVIDSP